MAFDLQAVATTVLQFHQSHRMSKIQEEHQKEQRELQRRTLEETKAMREHMERQMGVAPLHPMTVQANGQVFTLQPMQAMAPMQTQPAEQPPAAAPAPAQQPDKPYSNYLKEYGHNSRDAVSVGCVPCTRAHLSTVAAALKRAESGDPEAVASAREEMAALIEYDLTPDKLAATPEIDRQVLAKYAKQIDDLRHELSGPVPEITTASASLKEAMRFARADGVEHPEVQIRMARTEDLVNEMERVSFAPERLEKLSPEQKARVKAVLPKLREARQDLINNVTNADDLEAVTVRIAEIDQVLNPAPEPAKVHEAASRATKLNTEFRRDVIAAWTKGGAKDVRAKE